MSLAPFVHLRVHTAYSLLEGAIHIADLAARCRAERMPAVAMTDSANLFGALEFSETLAAAGIQPIIGVTLPVETPYAEPLRPGGEARCARPLVLLAQNETGYRNLMALVSKAHLASEPHEAPHVTLDDLGRDARSEGLIALSGGPEGPLGHLLRGGQHDKAAALVDDLAALFPGRLYIEIMRHGLAAEGETEAAFLDIAYARELPLVATNQCFFPDADMYEAHDALLCIAAGAYVSESERRRLTPEHRFKSAAEMEALFADLPEAVLNTRVVAQRCAYRPEPVAPILPRFATDMGESEADMLRRLAAEGLARRLESQVYGRGDDERDRQEKAAPYRERLAYELDVIIRMGFAGYFLIVSDFIRWAKDHDIPVGPGRGSGAGSLVAWALRITELDPLRFSLLFERFLNPERVSMPDFDIDFCQEKRERVIRYV
ncbi:MAG: DNA polymerase III subunit alpha, partial [Rhodothalassiaceae bacterium]